MRKLWTACLLSKLSFSLLSLSLSLSFSLSLSLCLWELLHGSQHLRTSRSSSTSTRLLFFSPRLHACVHKRVEALCRYVVWAALIFNACCPVCVEATPSKLEASNWLASSRVLLVTKHTDAHVDPTQNSEVRSSEHARSLSDTAYFYCLKWSISYVAEYSTEANMLTS